ncbi:Uncharacterised protein [Candidatus Gugararchaeum adminiculabundum]|nr:Uncharacterised protein [Candidatus Gugararchaeum adminiculabundum]
MYLIYKSFVSQITGTNLPSFLKCQFLSQIYGVYLKKSVSERARKQLLAKLYSIGAWGTHHVCLSNLPKSFPPHNRGLVKEVAQSLRKEGLLIMRPSSHDSQCYLNIQRKEEIEKIIRD